MEDRKEVPVKVGPTWRGDTPEDLEVGDGVLQVKVHVLSDRGQGECPEDATVRKKQDSCHPSGIPACAGTDGRRALPITIDERIPTPLGLQGAAHFCQCSCT